MVVFRSYGSFVPRFGYLELLALFKLRNRSYCGTGRNIVSAVLSRGHNTNHAKQKKLLIIGNI